jgi:phosphoribosylanthranilate isomerase
MSAGARDWRRGHGIVKVCGLTNAVDARAALLAGADLAGLIFAESPRRVAPRAAAGWVGALKAEFPRAGFAGIFLPRDAGRIAEVLAAVPLDLIQFHGYPAPAEVYRHGPPVMPCLRIRDGSEGPPAGDPGAWAFLLDTYDRGREGGTGRPFAWDRVRGWSGRRRILLAGGLGPDNVAAAIRTVQPHGVDASSRLEQTPGRKDHQAVRRFVEAARGAFQEAGADADGAAGNQSKGE